MKLWGWLIVVLLIPALSGCLDDGALKVGSKAPSLRTKTLADVDGDFSRITTYRYPDKRMYQLSLDDALSQNKVIVLAFATPGHCTACDKHLQMLKAILDKYEQEVLFLHMDQYQNPGAFKAFVVIGDPWTYIIDQKQTVRFRRAGRAGRMLYREMDIELANLLKEGKAG